MLHQGNFMERTRNAVAVQMLTTPDDRKHPTRNHWATALVKNIEVNYPQQFGQVPTLRFRTITHENKPCYSIKQSHNRVRITLMPIYTDESSVSPRRVRVLTYALTDVDVNRPAKPRYPHVPMSDITFDYMDQYDELVDHCVAMASMENAYSRNDHARIQYTTILAEKTGRVFFGGKIHKVLLREDNMWHITLENNQKVRVFANAFGSSKPLVNFCLIYKNEHEVEVVTEADFRRYYIDIMSVVDAYWSSRKN